MNKQRLIAILFLAALALRVAGDQTLAQEPPSKSGDGRAIARSRDEIQQLYDSPAEAMGIRESSSYRTWQRLALQQQLAFIV